MRQNNLFLAVTIPADMLPGEDDPEAAADEVVRLLNQQRSTEAAARAMLDGAFDVENGHRHPERIFVNGIPAAQWLTPQTLDNLRTAAAIDPADIRAILTAYDWHVPRDCRGPWRDRLAAVVNHSE